MKKKADQNQNTPEPPTPNPQSLSSPRIAASFSRKAANYDELAVMQKEIAGKLLAMLPEGNYNDIIDIGCGTGYLCGLIRDLYPDSCISGIDIAPGMIDIAKEKIASVDFMCKSVSEIKHIGSSFDLVFSSNTLHWISDISDCLQTFYDVLNRSGILLIATFIEPSLPELRQSFSSAYNQLKIPEKKHVIQFPQRDVLLREMTRHFDIIYEEMVDYQLQYPSARDMLHKIKDIGGSYSFSQPQSLSEKKKVFSSVFSYYDQNYKTDQGTVRQSWKVLFVGARKA